MLSAKETAKNLFNKYATYVVMWSGGVNVEIQNCKQCALIAVDEIINASPSLPMQGDGGTFGEDIELSTKYWQDVKSEIQKL